MPVGPYLFFDGNCEEALAFYESAIGSKTTVKMRFSDAPPGQSPPGFPPEKIMHSEFTVADATLMASDGRQGELGATTAATSLMTMDVAEAKRGFEGLAAGGTVAMPFAEMFFSPGFGMLTDKFGITWMVMTLPPEG